MTTVENLENQLGDLEIKLAKLETRQEELIDDIEQAAYAQAVGGKAEKQALLELRAEQQTLTLSINDIKMAIKVGTEKLEAAKIEQVEADRETKLVEVEQLKKDWLNESSAIQSLADQLADGCQKYEEARLALLTAAADLGDRHAVNKYQRKDSVSPYLHSSLGEVFPHSFRRRQIGMKSDFKIIEGDTEIADAILRLVRSPLKAIKPLDDAKARPAKKNAGERASSGIIKQSEQALNSMRAQALANAQAGDRGR